jgi:hypothetical protein
MAETRGGDLPVRLRLLQPRIGALISVDAPRAPPIDMRMTNFINWRADVFLLDFYLLDELQKTFIGMKYYCTSIA